MKLLSRSAQKLVLTPIALAAVGAGSLLLAAPAMADEAVTPVTSLTPQLVFEATELDPDADGLPLAYEEAYGTDGELVDSDGDLAWDGVEVILGSDPMDPLVWPEQELMDKLVVEDFALLPEVPVLPEAPVEPQAPTIATPPAPELSTPVKNGAKAQGSRVQQADCGDFDSRDDAQAYYLYNGDRSGLKPDPQGRVCMDYDYSKAKQEEPKNETTPVVSETPGTETKDTIPVPRDTPGNINCDSFDSREDAQLWFDANNPDRDPEGLDGPEGPTSDGSPNVVCEGEVYPELPHTGGADLLLPLSGLLLAGAGGTILVRSRKKEMKGFATV